MYFSDQVTMIFVMETIINNNMYNIKIKNKSKMILKNQV